MYVHFVWCFCDRFAVDMSLRWERGRHLITSMSCYIFLQAPIYLIINLRNVSAQPVHAAADQSMRSTVMIRTYSRPRWFYLPLVLAGFASEEVGQCGDSIKVTGVSCGRTRQRGEGFSKDSHLQERQKTSSVPITSESQKISEV